MCSDVCPWALPRWAKWRNASTSPHDGWSVAACDTTPSCEGSDGEHVIDSLLQLLAMRRPYSDDTISDIPRRQRVFRGIFAHAVSRLSVLDAFIAEYGALECFELPG